jgi:outer membrane lipoprotein carrier protein
VLRFGETFMNKKLLLLTLFFTLAAFARAAGDLERQALETLRRGFAGTTDFTAEITQQKHLSMMKKQLVSRGVVRFKKPDTFFMELYPPHASRLLLQDNVMSLRLGGQAASDRVVLPPEEGLKKWFTYLARPVTTLPEAMDLKAERRGKAWVLQLFPKSPGAVRQLGLHFDSEGNIGKIEIAERNRDRTVILFDKIRRNVGLRESDFKIE